MSDLTRQSTIGRTTYQPVSNQLSICEYSIRRQRAHRSWHPKDLEWIFSTCVALDYALNKPIFTKLHRMMYYAGQYFHNYGCSRRGDTDECETMYNTAKSSYNETNKRIAQYLRRYLRSAPLLRWLNCFLMKIRSNQNHFYCQVSIAILGLSLSVAKCELPYRASKSQHCLATFIFHAKMMILTHYLANYKTPFKNVGYSNAMPSVLQ